MEMEGGAPSASAIEPPSFFVPGTPVVHPASSVPNPARSACAGMDTQQSQQSMSISTQQTDSFQDQIPNDSYVERLFTSHAHLQAASSPIHTVLHRDTRANQSASDPIVSFGLAPDSFATSSRLRALQDMKDGPQGVVDDSRLGDFGETLAPPAAPNRSGELLRPEHEPEPILEPTQVDSQMEPTQIHGHSQDEIDELEEEDSGVHQNTGLLPPQLRNTRPLSRSSSARDESLRLSAPSASAQSTGAPSSSAVVANTLLPHPNTSAKSPLDRPTFSTVSRSPKPRSTLQARAERLSGQQAQSSPDFLAPGVITDRDTASSKQNEPISQSFSLSGPETSTPAFAGASRPRDPLLNDQRPIPPNLRLLPKPPPTTTTRKEVQEGAKGKPIKRAIYQSSAALKDIVRPPKPQLPSIWQSQDSLDDESLLPSSEPNLEPINDEEEEEDEVGDNDEDENGEKDMTLEDPGAPSFATELETPRPTANATKDMDIDEDSENAVSPSFYAKTNFFDRNGMPSSPRSEAGSSLAIPQPYQSHFDQSYEETPAFGPDFTIKRGLNSQSQFHSQSHSHSHSQSQSQSQSQPQLRPPNGSAPIVGSSQDLLDNSRRLSDISELKSSMEEPSQIVLEATQVAYDVEDYNTHGMGESQESFPRFLHDTGTTDSSIRRPEPPPNRKLQRRAPPPSSLVQNLEPTQIMEPTQLNESQSTATDSHPLTTLSVPGPSASLPKPHSTLSSNGMVPDSQVEAKDHNLSNSLRHGDPSPASSPASSAPVQRSRSLAFPPCMDVDDSAHGGLGHDPYSDPVVEESPEPEPLSPPPKRRQRSSTTRKSDLRGHSTSAAVPIGTRTRRRSEADGEVEAEAESSSPPPKKLKTESKRGRGRPRRNAAASGPPPKSAVKKASVSRSKGRRRSASENLPPQASDEEDIDVDDQPIAGPSIVRFKSVDSNASSTKGKPSSKVVAADKKPAKSKIPVNWPYSRLMAWYPKDKRYYPCTINGVVKGKGEFDVVYDDGDGAKVKFTKTRRCQICRGDWIEYYRSRKGNDVSMAQVVRVERRGEKVSDEEDLLQNDTIFVTPPNVALDDLNNQPNELGPIQIPFSWYVPPANVSQLDSRRLPPQDIALFVDRQSHPLKLHKISTSPGAEPLQINNIRDRILSGYGFIVTITNAEHVESFQFEQSKEQLNNLITDNGGTIIDPVQLFTIATHSESKTLSLSFKPTSFSSIHTILLLSNTTSKTAKYLTALALGVPCISKDFVNESINEGKALDWSPYALTSGLDGPLIGGAVRALRRSDHTLIGIKAAYERGEGVFDGATVLVVIPKSKAAKDVDTFITSTQRIFVAGGAIKVDFVKNNEAAKSAFEYEYIVRDDAESLPKSLNGHDGVRGEDWIKRCLLSGRIVE